MDGEDVHVSHGIVLSIVVGILCLIGVAICGILKLVELFIR
jgi:hypothetical protein